MPKYIYGIESALQEAMKRKLDNMQISAPLVLEMGLKIKESDLLFAEINDYLNTNDLTSIGHGSILHKKIISILME